MMTKLAGFGVRHMSQPGEGQPARDEIRDDGTLTCHNTLLPDEGDTDQWVTGMSTPHGVF